MKKIVSFRKNGLPNGITFRAHPQQPGAYVIRVFSADRDTLVSLNPNDSRNCFNAAVDKRLEFISESGNEELRQQMRQTYNAWLEYYGIEFKPVISYIIEVKGKQ